MTVTCHRCASRFDVVDDKVPVSGLFVKCPQCATPTLARRGAVVPPAPAVVAPPIEDDVPELPAFRRRAASSTIGGAAGSAPAENTPSAPPPAVDAGWFTDDNDPDPPTPKGTPAAMELAPRTPAVRPEPPAAPPAQDDAHLPDLPAPVLTRRTPPIVTSSPPRPPAPRVFTPAPPASDRLAPPAVGVPDSNDLMGELPGLDDITDEEFTGAHPGHAPVVDLLAPRGHRNGPTGPMPIVADDHPDLLKPKAKRPSRPPILAAPVDIADDDRTPLPPAMPGGPPEMIALDGDAFAPPHQGAPSSTSLDIPLQLDDFRPLAPAAEPVSPFLAEAPSQTSNWDAPSSPKPEAAKVKPSTPPVRLGRALLLAGGAVVVGGAALGALFLFNHSSEATRRKKDAARAFASAQRLLADDTVASYHKAAANLRDVTAADPAAQSARALEAEADLSIGLLGSTAEVRLADRVLAAIPAETQPGDAPEVAKARALRRLVDGRTAEAEALLKPIARGTDVVAFVYLGWTHLAAADPKQAKDDFKQALSVEPHRAQSLYGLGRAHEALGELAAAGENYKKTLAESPSHLGAALGVERLSTGDAAASEQRVRALLDRLAASAGARDLAEAWSLLAVRATEVGRLAEAEERYKRAIAIMPTLSSPKVGLARVLVAQHRGREAIPVAEGVVKLQPRDGPALLALAEAQLDARLLDAAGRTIALAAKVAKKGDVALLTGRFEEARGGPGADDRAAAQYRAAVDADPHAVDAWLALSRVLAHAGKPDDAAKALAQAEAQASADPVLRDRLGEAYVANGALDKAETAFRDVIERAPDLVSARFHLGETLERANKLDQAAALYDQFAATHKSLPGLAERRAHVALRRGRTDEALAFYQEAYAELAASHIAPSPALRAAAADAYLAAGKVAEARRELEAAALADDRSPAAQLGLAVAALADGRPDDGEAHAKRAVQLGGGADAHLMLARSLELLNRMEDARGEYGAAARGSAGANPVIVIDGRLGAARILARQGALKDALAEAQSIATAAPDRAEPLVLAGDCLEELNQPDKAKRSYEAALKKGAGSAEAAFKLARVEADAGHDKAAAALVDRALRSGGAKPPFAIEAWLLSGDLHRRLGERAPAIAAYRKYLELARPDAPERRPVGQKLDALEAGE